MGSVDCSLSNQLLGNAMQKVCDVYFTLISIVTQLVHNDMGS